MLRRFIKVVDGLYRGSGPEPEDVINLHNFFNIKKIVSLDEQASKDIKRICQIIGIKQIIIPLNATKVEPLAKLLKYDLGELLLDGGPTYVHCIEGKDRTGMVIAMFKCAYMGWSYDRAIKEAKSIGFGVGLNPEVREFYEKAVKLYCNKEDENSANIVDNTREFNSDFKGSVLDQASMPSFAPFLDYYSRQYPWTPTYDYDYFQFPTRNNHDLIDIDEDHYNKEDEGSETPLVGLYDNDAGIRGAGPVDIGSGYGNV